MKKLLLLAFACVMACGANAQEAFRFIGEDGLQFSKISNDGKIMATTDMDGNAIIYNYDTDETTIYSSDYNFETDSYSPHYFFGFGRGCADNGMMVGAIDECTPGYYQNGEWIALPVPAEVHKPGMMSQADDITPDASRICGVLAAAGFGSDGTMVTPCIWNKNADGTYGMPVVLPYPEKDFTGRAPQYVTARCISNDGKTIVGQVTDYSGWFLFPIIYKEDAKGEWSYQMLTNLVVNENAEWPVIPAEPKEVKPTDYMDDAHAAAYEVAVAEHDAAVDEYWQKYWSGEEAEYPADVDLALYVTDVEGYNAAVTAYLAAAEAYNEAQNKFWDMGGDPECVYGRNFEFNTLSLSADGRYYGAMFTVEEPDDDPMAWFPFKMVAKTVALDLQNDNAMIECPLADCAPTCFLQDGTLVLSAPAGTYTRDTYLWKLGQEPISLAKELETSNPAAAKELKENSTHKLVGGYDEENDWAPIEGDEVCMVGTAVATPDAKVWVGWQSNDFYGEDSWYLMSWCLNLNAATGINTTSVNNTVQNYTVTNMAGVVLYRGANKAAANKAMGKGVNIITSTKANGETETFKIIKK